MTNASWISVNERLPSRNEDVLVYVPNGQYRKVFIDEWGDYRECPVDFSTVSVVVGEGWAEHEFDEVTHWAPLPALPLAAVSRSTPRPREL